MAAGGEAAAACRRWWAEDPWRGWRVTAARQDDDAPNLGRPSGRSGPLLTLIGGGGGNTNVYPTVGYTLDTLWIQMKAEVYPSVSKVLN